MVDFVDVLEAICTLCLSLYVLISISLIGERVKRIERKVNLLLALEDKDA